MDLNRYLIKYYYIGSEKYSGSQRQNNSLTIEDCLLYALKEKGYIKKEKGSSFEVASRTDKFVSARCAVFSFLTEKDPILMEINNALPWDIGTWAFAKVSTDFTSRFNAFSRHYKYIIQYERGSLDEALLEKACREFEGAHDFTNFSKKGKKEVLTRRDIDHASVQVNPDFLIFDFKSKAFLRQQIRRMVTKILEVGKGIISYDEFLALFEKEEYVSYQPADPEGLILWDILYDDSVVFTIDPRARQRMLKYFSLQEKQLKLKAKLFSVLQHDDIC